MRLALNASRLIGTTSGLSRPIARSWFSHGSVDLARLRAVEWRSALARLIPNRASRNATIIELISGRQRNSRVVSIMPFR